MRILLSTLLFFFISIQISASTIDASDNNKITKHFNAYVDNGSLPNISILIKKDNKEIYRHSYGFADIDEGLKVNKKTVYRIYSMTKPVTGCLLYTSDAADE